MPVFLLKNFIDYNRLKLVFISNTCSLPGEILLASIGIFDQISFTKRLRKEQTGGKLS